MSKKDESFNTELVKDLGWIDIHTHLNFLEVSPEKALASALDKGIDKIITIGTEPEDLPIVLDLAEKLSPNVYCTLGIHPHEAEKFTPDTDAFLQKELDGERVVAVGEIGLDYYYDHSDREVQRSVFRRHMELAAEKKLPVEIHTRDAEEDTVKILQDFKGSVNGVIHCFTGSQWLAEKALDCGFNISFSGILTFKNADDLRAVAKATPLDRMHVETDAPFLTPMPYRGIKNEPQYVIWTAKLMSELKQVPLEDLCKTLRQNAFKVFPKLNN